MNEADIRRIDITGSPEHPEGWIYRLGEDGVFVREAVFDSGKNDGDPAVLIQLTDLHFNLCTAADESDEEVMYTKQCRKWNADGVSARSAERAMRYAAPFDQTIVTGDSLDYLSKGAEELMRKYVFDADPNVLAALGGHDVTKQMQTGIRDKTPAAERYAELSRFWIHDISYVSRVIKNKVMAVVLDNGAHSYSEGQAGRLDADIRTAREKGYIMLIFQHEPVSTGDPADTDVPAIRRNDPWSYDLYNCLGHGASGATEAVYRLITENADVVRGLFCGHLHSDFYSEVKASYAAADGSVVKTVVPQYILTGNVYDGQAGHAMKITVR